MKQEYSVQIVWSKEDGAYLAVVQELPGCMADGQTPEEALRNVKEIAQEWIATAKEEKRDIPPPMSSEDFEERSKNFQKAVHQYVQDTVMAAVNAIVPAAVNEIVPKIIEKIKAQEDESLWPSSLRRAGGLEFVSERLLLKHD